MSDSHNHEETRSSTLTLPEFEAHFASVCVAIVFGTIGGHIAALFSGTLTIWVVAGLTAFLGFIIPWLVCRYLFKTAHVWYGANSFAHRLYDSSGVVAAFVVFIVTYWKHFFG